MMEIRRIYLFIVISLCSFLAIGQNRIPHDGENIIFYPLNQDNECYFEGYDCFYSLEQVLKNGKYNFKPKYRFKKNENLTTSPKEIEGYTFKVINHEILYNNTPKKTLLLFLNRNEDNQKVIMRIPWHIDKKSNKITQSFFKYKREDKFSLTNTTTLMFINLPFVNADSLISIKNKFEDTLIVFKNNYSNGLKNRTDDFNIIVKDINNGNSLKSYNVYNCTDINFRNIYISDIYKQLCASLTDNSGKTFIIPVAYFVGNNNMTDSNNGSAYYFFNLLFTEKNKYNIDMYREYGCEHIVNKYKGKKVYYGFNHLYKYDNTFLSTDASENRILGKQSLYKLIDGFYECVGFDVQQRYEDYIDPIPFAILKDEEGILFRVPVCKTRIGKSYYGKNIYCESFDKYFILEEEAIKIKNEILLEKQKEETLKEKIKQEQNILRKEKLQEITTKFGENYAKFLKTKSNEVIERFITLSQKYGKENAKLIIERKLCIGWPADMCKESWGKPDRINKTTTVWGVHEQWVYEYDDKNSYLYFEKDVLTTVQN